MRVFCTCIPKSGTHLLVSAFVQLGCRPVAVTKAKSIEAAALHRAGAIVAYGHWRFSQGLANYLAEHDYSVLVLIRDPRDICLSFADFFKAGRPREAAARAPSLRQMPLDELVRGAIAGMTVEGWQQPPIAGTCIGWLEWQSAGATLLRYEDLCVQSTNLPAIPSVSSELFRDALAASYQKPSATLNHGRPYRWLAEFGPEMLAYWNEHASGVAASLGYRESR